MQTHFPFILGVAVTATLFAMVEIHIEGPRGWAESLPTWRTENRWTRLFYSMRPLTGYHLYVQLFVLVFSHVPYATGIVVPSWRIEAKILSFVALFWLLEDFLWFVLNPAFGLKAFKKERIWWHAPTWWWIMPRDYWILAPAGVVLYVLSL